VSPPNRDGIRARESGGLRRDVEIDFVTRQVDGRILTGSAEFRRRPADAPVFLEHVEALRRLSDSGLKWAEEALAEASPMRFASASGFKDSFHEVASDAGRQALAREVADLCGERITGGE
jgi:hypothetical protein